MVVSPLSFRKISSPARAGRYERTQFDRSDRHEPAHCMGHARDEAGEPQTGANTDNHRIRSNAISVQSKFPMGVMARVPEFFSSIAPATYRFRSPRDFETRSTL
jgi:hypothetical protein